MQRYLDHFFKLAQLPRCSGSTEVIQKYIIDCVQEYGYHVEVDGSGNVLASKKGAQTTLQAHYDMVCIGDVKNMEVVVENGYIFSKNSSLGADNAIACAMMLALMQEGAKVDCLFTNDEEIGLIGAKNIDLTLKNKRLLNLDAQEYGKIYLGCAGGVDLEFSASNDYVDTTKPNQYEVMCNSQGGHSGVDIDKGIENSLKQIVAFLAKKDVELVSIKGGERANAIAAYAKAVVRAKDLQSDEKVKVVAVNSSKDRVLKNSTALLNLLDTLPNGVLKYDEQLQAVQDSCNLALLHNNSFTISIRSMQESGLDKTVTMLKEHFSGYKVREFSRYEPWEPKVTAFAKEVKQAYKDAEFAAIHAGLECAILSKKFPDLEIVSIGPDIYFPHSVKEKCNLASCEKIFKLIKILL